MTKIYRITRAFRGKMPSSTYIERELGMPGIKCEGLAGCCGATWSDAVARIATEPPPGTCNAYEFGACVPAEVFLKQAAKTRIALNLPRDYELRPGLNLGRLHIKCSSMKTLAMEWPALFGFIVREDLLDAIKRHGLTGFEESEVIVKRAANMLLKPIPKFTEILVTGKGGWARTDPPLVIEPACPVCGRRPTDNKDYQNIELDESQWDGSDIFRFEHPFGGYIFVTQRWVDAIPESKFDGFRYETTDEMLLARSKV